MIDLGLNGRRAVVVGAGFKANRAGHGRATALKLAAAGATVACLDIDEGRARAAAEEVEASGGRAFAVVGDVADPHGAEATIDEAVAGLGGIDVVVDIVGDARWSHIEDTTNEEWDWAILNNLTQVKYVYTAALRHMIPQGTGGSLVALSSVDGIGSSKLHAAYGAAKAGLIHLTKTYAEELGRYGIRVNTVAPGNVGGGVWDDPEIPFGSNPVNPLSPPRPHDIADGVLFLSSSLAQRVTGQTLVVDGGVLVRSPWGFTDDDMAYLADGNAVTPETISGN